MSTPYLSRGAARIFKLLTLACWAASTAAFASEYHGQVTLGAFPVPGVLLTATQSDKKLVAVSDTQGVYTFPDLPDGTWTIQVDMTGFAVLKQDVTIAPNLPAAKWELKLLSLDQIRTAAKPIKVDPAAPVVAAAPAVPAKKPEPAANKKDAPKPVDNATVAAAAAPEEPRSSDGLLINGSVNNAATSQFALAPAFGNTRSGGRALYNGGITVFLDNSALDARQFSVTGLQSPEPSHSTETISLAFQGPIRIPHYLPRGPNFSINYQWTRSTTAQTTPYLVPTLNQRNGILPTGNVTPVSQAVALLKFYPLPNITGSSQYNYQIPLISDRHQDALNLRLNKGIGQKDQFYGGFAYQSTRSGAPNVFGFLDTTNNLGLTTNVNWQHRLHQRWIATLGYTYSRSRNQVIPNFANRTNVSQAAGITGNSQKDPRDWGPPNLNFSSGIAGLNDANSAYNRNQSNALTLGTTWTRTRHNVSFGVDFRRLEFNYLSQQNPRGSFSFTGQGAGGSDFADFLLGVPDTSAIAYGNADKYFRQSQYDGYIQDDWRARPDLTINGGLRWEYNAPLTELFGRLVNLDINPGFSKATPVLANNPVGALTGLHYPTSLVKPDKLGIEPRIGISWRPISGSSVLVKAGYGINRDTSVYQAATVGMAQQAPLSTSLLVANSAACPLTLAAGFLPCSTTTADTFAIDPDFRVGYLQSWQLSVQRDLPAALQMTVTYLGNKGTRGTQQFLPNTYPVGGTNPCASCPSGFTYRTSNGGSTRESGNLQLRRRLKNGLTATLSYTYSKSIDNDAFLGGQGSVSSSATSTTTAQDWRNLRGERGLSSFDQRHLLNLQVQYTTGMGIGGRTLMSGWKGLAYKEWTVVTNITAGTGLPETPIYAAVVGGTGLTGPIRPNVTGAPIHVTSGGSFLNVNAFSAPLLGQWGNARRNSITGPNQFTLNLSMQRSFRLHDRYSLQARLDSNNALNHVTYTGWNYTLNPITNPNANPAFTTANNPLFGLPTSANTMRTVTATMSLRF